MRLHDACLVVLRHNDLKYAIRIHNNICDGEVTMPHNDILASFETSVASQGYEWKHMADGPVLVERPPTRARRNTILPFSQGRGTLFRQFSELKQTKDAILEFVNQFGFLGAPVTQHFQDGRLSGRDISAPLGELFDAKLVSARTRKTLKGDGLGHLCRHAWVDHIKWMAAILRAADRCRAGKTLWQGPVMTLGLTKIRVIPTNRARPIPSKPPTPKQRALEGPYVANRLSKVLSDVAVPHVEWDPRGQDGGRFRLLFRPSSLIGCLWLQAATALSEQKAFRPCHGPACDKTIELSLDREGKRADAQFCSTTCRSRDYRRRRKEANALAREGLTPAKIAKALRSNTKTVQAWLSAR